MKIKMRLALLLAAIVPVALSAATCNYPSVPDSTNTLLLLGAGLGAMVAMKKKLSSQKQ